MIKKTYFEAPQAELIYVSFEEGFLINSPGETGGAGGSTPYAPGDEQDVD